MQGILVSNKNPFTPSLNKFIQKHGNICQDKAADVEAKEFSGVTSA
jgi:hypothetical protein